MKTYNDVYIDARRRLRMAGVPMFDLEARLIVSHVSGMSQADFLRDNRRACTDNAFAESVDKLIARRESGEPLAYIVGEWEFYGLPLTISPSVLIPRADTETLVDAAIDILRHSPCASRVLDLCAGSGCIGLAIAANVQNCHVVLADISAGALEICGTNILRNGLTDRVTPVKADALDIPPAAHGTFDVIVCNPPYIPAWEIDTLEQSVKDFEPVTALVGGDDGLDFYRDVSDKWRSALSPGGTLLYECGAGQADDVCGIMRTNGFTDIIKIRDTQGIERVVTGRIGG